MNLEEIEARALSASDGNYTTVVHCCHSADGDDHIQMIDHVYGGDGVFFERARADVLELIAEVKRLRALAATNHHYGPMLKRLADQ